MINSGSRAIVAATVSQIVFYAALAGASATASRAQAIATPNTDSSPPSQTPAATANVDEVSLDIVVHDKKHRQVLDLTGNDLAVTDNDTPVKLKDLHLVKADSATDHAVTLLFDRFAGPTAKLAQTVSDKILRALPEKGYSFAVLDTGGRLRLLQSFTQNREFVRDAVKAETEAAIDKHPVVELESTGLIVDRGSDKPDAAKTLSAQAEKELIATVRTGADSSGNHADVQTRSRMQLLLSAMEGAPQIQQDQHTLPQLAALLSLVRAEQKLNARKAVVYFTVNQQLDSAAKEMLHTIAGAANQAGVTLYVVDMDAMDVGGKYQIDNAIGAQNVAFSPAPQVVPGSGGHAMTVPTEEAGPSGPTSTVGMAIDWTRQSDKHPFTEVKSPMAAMAAETGGAYMDAQDNVKKPLEQMVNDLTTYYQASYVPPIEEYDGSFRTISTKPLREGLDIKTKTGYFAVAASNGGTVRPFEAPLLNILNQAQLPATFKFHAAVLKFGELPDGNTSSVAVEVPLSAIQPRKDARTNLFHAHVAIVAQIKDADGTVVEHFSEDIHKRGALETLDNGTAEPISMERHFLAIPGKYTLEVAVADEVAETAAAQKISFEIGPSQSTPSLSEMVLVRKVDGAGQDDDPLEPLRYENGRIMPDLTGDIPIHQKSVSLFFILHPDPKSKDPVTLQMSAGRNGRPGKLMTLPLRLDESGGAVPYLASFKSGLAPGDYEVKATISQGGKSDVRSLAFTVEGGDAEGTTEVAKGGPQGGDGKTTDAVVTPDADVAGGVLAITPSANPMAAPAPDEVQQLIADTRGHAVTYADSLPNFLCVEVTNRSFDPTGTGKWRHRDTLAELLRYREKQETRTPIELNGKSSTTDREALNGKQSAFSTGELGGVLTTVFSPRAQADFKWQETDTLGTGTVQVFSYKVAQPNSQFSVVGMNDQQVMVAFHGLVFIDTATRNVRRISMVADDLPKDFPTRFTSITVDYDYVSINSHDYLMPVSAQMRLRQGRHQDILNSMEFRDYRRFGSNVKIVGGFTPVDRQ